MTREIPSHPLQSWQPAYDFPPTISAAPRLRATHAVIYSPSRPATQSGTRRTKSWVLEFEPRTRPKIDFLMGWTGESDTDGQIRLQFPDRESAESFARTQGLASIVIDRTEPQLRPKSYAANFSETPPR